MTIFSEDLIQETIAYYAEEHDHHISEETAQEYLESMAGLYLAFTNFCRVPEKPEAEAGNSLQQ